MDVNRDVFDILTWEEFLSCCDVSDWRFSDISNLNIVEETESYFIAKLDLSDIFDEPDFRYCYTDDNSLIVDWGVPIEILNPYDYPDIYIAIYKDRFSDGYHCNGQLYTSIEDIKAIDG